MRTQSVGIESSFLQDPGMWTSRPGITFLDETSLMEASTVIKAWSVRSVPFMLRIQLTPFSPRIIICSNPTQFQQPWGSTRVSIWTRVHFHLQVLAIYRWYSHGSLSCLPHWGRCARVRRVAIFSVWRINSVLRTTRSYQLRRPNLHGDGSSIGIAWKRSRVFEAFWRDFVDLLHVPHRNLAQTYVSSDWLSS